MKKTSLIITNKKQTDHELVQVISDLTKNHYHVLLSDEVEKASAIDLLVIFLSIPETNDKISRVDLDQIDQQYQTVLLDRIPIIERALSLMGHGLDKRICFISDEEASISNTKRKENYGFQMISSSIHMFAALLFNEYRPQGYTFRLFSKKQGLTHAVPYFLKDRSYEAHDLKHSDEERFVIRNGWMQEQPW